jgi:hypothetical protein
VTPAGTQRVESWGPGPIVSGGDARGTLQVLHGAPDLAVWRLYNRNAGTNDYQDASLTGLDFVVIDLEHSTLGRGADDGLLLGA